MRTSVKEVILAPSFQESWELYPMPVKLCISICAIGTQGSMHSLTDVGKAGVQRYANFATLGNAYAREHGTRPSTTGLVLSASPVSLLAWVGEK